MKDLKNDMPGSLDPEPKRRRFGEPLKFLPVAFVVSAIAGLWLGSMVFDKESRNCGFQQLTIFTCLTFMLVLCYVRSILTQLGEISENDPKWEYLPGDPRAMGAEPLSLQEMKEVRRAQALQVVWKVQAGPLPPLPTFFLSVLVTMFLGLHVWLTLKSMTTIEFCEKSSAGKDKNGDSKTYDSVYDLGFLGSMRTHMEHGRGIRRKTHTKTQRHRQPISRDAQGVRDLSPIAQGHGTEVVAMVTPQPNGEVVRSASTCKKVQNNIRLGGALGHVLSADSAKSTANLSCLPDFYWSRMLDGRRRAACFGAVCHTIQCSMAATSVWLQKVRLAR
ncbi:unnamed protein product [Polarella glacialis]|uniref:Palmitoyltransferase n=1 Tax=Polarella glacialis TaxID=89957 RepID=A0A813HQ82_POLGL|nr:unnamed protein product [Polarella glacialis]